MHALSKTGSDDATRISPFFSRFTSKTTEADYRAYAFEQNLRANRVGILLGAVLFALYAALDLFNLTDPFPAIRLRLGAAGAAFLVYGTSGWRASTKA